MKQVVLSPFSRKENGVCKIVIGLSWATQLTSAGPGAGSRTAWLLSSRSLFYATLPVSQLQTARWWSITAGKAHWRKAHRAGGLVCCWTLRRITWWELHYENYKCLWKKAFLLLALQFLVRQGVCVILEGKPQTERHNSTRSRPRVWREDKWDL